MSFIVVLMEVDAYPIESQDFVNAYTDGSNKLPPWKASPQYEASNGNIFYGNINSSKYLDRHGFQDIWLLHPSKISRRFDGSLEKQIDHRHWMTEFLYTRWTWSVRQTVDGERMKMKQLSNCFLNVMCFSQKKTSNYITFVLIFIILLDW